jgi:hypothetical protein
MLNSYEEEMGRMVDFAQSGRQTEKSLKIGAAKDKGPSTRTSTEKWVNWNNSDFLGQPFDVNRIALSKLEQMQRDPTLAFGLQFVKVPLIRAPWHIESEDPQRAAFIENALKRIYGRFILSYCNSLSYGYSAMVKKFELANPDWTYLDKNDKEKKEKLVWPDKKIDAVIWKPFTALNPRDVTPVWNAVGEFNGIEYNPNASTTYNFLSPKEKVPNIPLKYAMWATNEKDSVFGSIYGYPRLGYAYRYWWSYWYKFGLSDRAFEKWADPPILVYHPSEEGVDSSGEIVNFGEKALQTAESARSGANIAIPTKLATAGMEEKGTNIREWSIEQLKSETNFDALSEMFKYLDVQKLRALMVPEQSLIEGNSSARNVAKEFGDIFQESQVVIMQEIDDQINRYMIPQLLELNFGLGGPTCTKVTTGFDPQDIETMRVVVQAFANKNGEIPDVDIRETLTRLGLPLVTVEEALDKIQIADERNNLLNEKVFKQKTLEAGLKGHKPATGLSQDENDEVIEFSDNERSKIRQLFDKLIGVEKKEEAL